MFRNLFRRKPEEPAGAPPTGEGVRPDESPAALHDEFCRSFHHRPGVNFMDFLQAQGVTRMIAWLRPDNPSPLPGQVIRRLVDTTRKGVPLWEMPGHLGLFYESPGPDGGPPDQESLDALSVLAQIFEKPIKLYWEEPRGGETRVMEFAP